MNTVMNRSDVEYGLGIIMGAVDKKKIGEYTGSIFMGAKAGGKRIDLHATDMELFASVALECVSMERAGMIVLPAEKFMSSIKSCGTGEVVISSGDDLKTAIVGSGASYEISGLHPMDFPIGYTDDNQVIIYSMPAGRMADCIHAVTHAACRDVSKDSLNGINFILSDNGLLTVSATDGHRLSLATLEIPGECIQDKFKQHTFTLPHKASDLLGRITAGISVGRVAKQCRLYFQTGSISVCVNEGSRTFPDVRGIIPTGPGDIITVDTSAIITALESTCIMSDDQYRSVNLDIKEETITISALGANSTARAAIPCMSDSQIKIRINSRYLIQALKSMDSDETIIKYFGPTSPLMLMPADYKHWNERIEIVMMLRGE
jgi:DNA polymerase-3 subunit beta